MKQPSIILCTCDQLRAFELGCYGNPVIQTPNVNRLAEEGLRFETAVSNFPVCMAARSVLLSGQYNRTCTGGVDNVSCELPGGRRVMPDYPHAGRPHLRDKTLPEILREAGYHTRVIGKWHIHSWPDDIGFDEYLIPRVHHCHTGQNFTENGGPEFVPQGYSVDFEADRVEQFIESRKDTDDPFFLYYNIPVPHCPLADAPDQYLRMYDPNEVPMRANVDLDAPMDDQDLFFKVYRYDFKHYEMKIPYADKLPEGYSLKHLIAEYYGMVSWMDAALGRMLAALDRTGLSENTLVIFTSDHGDNLGSHGLVQKNSPNEESIRIPLVMRWPSRQSKPGICDHSHAASLVDIPATILSLLDLEVPEHFFGKDLSPALFGECSEGPSHAIFETSGGAGVRTLDWTCFIPFEEGSRQRLAAAPDRVFCNTSDPYQLDNLAGKQEFPELVSLIRNWEQQTPWKNDRAKQCR